MMKRFRKRFKVISAIVLAAILTASPFLCAFGEGVIEEIAEEEEVLSNESLLETETEADAMIEEELSGEEVIEETISEEAGEIQDTETADSEVITEVYDVHESVTPGYGSETASIEEMPAFCRTALVKGTDTKVTVTAPEGVFPKDAVVKAEYVSTGKKLARADEAVSEISDEGAYSEYVLDIKVLDADGNELQPDETVVVTFEIENEILGTAEEVNVYHIADDGYSLEAENLPVVETPEEVNGRYDSEFTPGTETDVKILGSDEAADEAKETVISVATTGFSIYVIVFKNVGKTYEMVAGDTEHDLGSTVNLTTINTSLGLGITNMNDVEKVVSSDSSFIAVTQISGPDWEIKAKVTKPVFSPKLFVVMKNKTTIVVPLTLKGQGDFKTMLDTQTDPGLPYTIKIYDSHGSEVDTSGVNVDIIPGEEYSFKLEYGTTEKPVKKGLIPGTYTENWLAGKKFKYSAGVYKSLTEWAALEGYDITLSGALEVTLPGGSKVNLGNFKVATDGQITFVVDESATMYQEVTGGLELALVFKTSGGTGDITLDKTGMYDPDDGYYKYELTATLPRSIDGNEYPLFELKDIISEPEYAELTGGANGAFSVAVIDDVKITQNSVTTTLNDIYDLTYAEIIGGVNQAYVVDAEYKFWLINKCNCPNPSSVCADVNTGNKCDTLKRVKYVPSRLQTGVDTYLTNNWCACWKSAYTTTLKVKYHLIKSDELIGLNGKGDKPEIINEATVKGTVKTTSLEAEAGAKVGIPSLIEKKVSSSASSKTGAVATYTLIINKPFFNGSSWDCIDIFKHKDSDNKYVITDQLINADFIDGSISASAVDLSGTKHNVEFDYSYTAPVLTIKIKNLTNPSKYTYTFSYDVKVSTGGSAPSVDYINEASIKLRYPGREITVKSSTSDKMIKDSHFDASTAKVRIHKINKAGSGVPEKDLNGAEISLYTFDGSDTVDLGSRGTTAIGYTGEINEHIVDIDPYNGADGYYTFVPVNSEGLNLVRGNVYCIAETKAPTGYKLNSDPADNRYWFYYRVDATDDSSAAVTAFNASSYNTETLHAINDEIVGITFKDSIEPVETTVGVTKEFESMAPTDTTNYQFTISAVTAGAPMPEGGNTITVDYPSVPSKSFGKITYTNEGEWEYKIVEDTTSPVPGVKYDNRYYKFKVKVEINSSGLLELTKTLTRYLHDGTADPDTSCNSVGHSKSVTQYAKFINDFTNKTYLRFKVLKNVTGSSRTPGKTFTFTLEAIGTAPIPADGVMSVTITDNGSTVQTPKEFDQITFDSEGTYEYRITETAASATGWSIDPNPSRTISVVIDKYTGGALYIKSITGCSLDGIIGSVQYVNKYTPPTPPPTPPSRPPGGGTPPPPWTPPHTPDPEPKTGLGAVTTDPQGTIYNGLKYYANGRGQVIPYAVTNQRLAPYYQINPDYRGTITYAGGTTIVMQSPLEPEFYINRTFEKAISAFGETFMAASSTLNDNNIIIYGHNMATGAQFGNLMSYQTVGFYLTHPTLRFDTIIGDGVYQIISVFREVVHYQDETNCFRYYSYYGNLSQTRFNEYVSKVKALSLYDTGNTAVYGDKLITLSTCSYHAENGRLVVVAKKIQ